MATQRKAPPYSEEQATAWLAWLAYNMCCRDQTIFQVESLQPDWLVDCKETTPYMILTRIFWGMYAGLIFGLIGGLIGGLSFGLVVGIYFGLIELLIEFYTLDTSLRSRRDRTSSLATGTIVIGLVTGLSLGLLVSPIAGLAIGLSVGLIFGFIRTFRVSLREPGEQVRMIESLQWSWQSVRSSVTKGIIFGLIFGFGIGLSVGLIVELIDGLVFGFVFGLVFGLIGALIGALTSILFGGFQPEKRELKTQPNQGMWLTIRSSIKIGPPVGVVMSILFGLFSWDMLKGLEMGLIAALIVSLWYGGLDTIEHGIIRLIIAWRGHAPLNYARFLDYAAEELNFLQKVGGGYVFIHRYLLEHFAEIAVEKGYVTLRGDQTGVRR